MVTINTRFFSKLNGSGYVTFLMWSPVSGVNIAAGIYTQVLRLEISSGLWPESVLKWYTIVTQV